MNPTLSPVIVRAFRLVAVMAAVLTALAARAFAPDSYAPGSRLAEGRWVKVSVSASGMHCLTPRKLAEMGFADPSQVRVYGYGALPLGDLLDAGSYIDDLPLVASEYTADGLMFYAVGPVRWTLDSSRHLVHTSNPYTTKGYYFLTDAPGLDASPPLSGSQSVPASAATVFTDAVCHESQLVSPGATGHTLLGEDFRYSSVRTFPLSLPGNVADSVWIRCSFAAKTIGGPSAVTLSSDGVALDCDGTIPPSGDDSHRHYHMRNFETVASTGGSPEIRVGIGFRSTASVRLARLDNIVVNYTRSLRLDDGCLDFTLDCSGSDGALLAGASADTRVWDVTDPLAVVRVNTAAVSDGDAVRWAVAADSGLRRYSAWTPGARFPAPEFVCEVSNQNLHALEVPDMVIITMPAWRAQATQLADLHRRSPDSLAVAVVTADEVFNEFSSGSPDYGAFRRLLKMLWDRGVASHARSRRLKYALMLGRGTYDHRALTGRHAWPVMPQWQSVDGSSDNLSYTTDDYLSFLLDGSGADPGADTHCIAVGRIPVTSADEARTVVEKISRYMADADKSEWKNRMLLVADDGDAGQHLLQAEQVAAAFGSDTGRDYMLHKVYVDAFPKVGNVVQGARDRMMRHLDSGVMWWLYIGHANTFSWTSEGLLTHADIAGASYAHQPMLYAATCDFLRWDADSPSGAEELFMRPRGIIGAVAATRPVYINANRDMSLAVASMIASREPDGRPLPVGEIMRRAKNSLLSTGDQNKLRFVLLGDPALRLAEPRASVVLESIDGCPVGADSVPVLKARQHAVLEGRIVDFSGRTMTAFDGLVMSGIYDAERSTVSEGRDDGESLVFEEQGERLFAGRDTVVSGRFRINVVMPGDIAGNFRPAALDMYAVAADGTDASGIERRFYVYGHDSSAPSDTVAPVIDSFVLDTDDFVSGATVNPSPVAMARISDDVAVNISSAGIGHTIAMQLDGNRSLPDVARHYIPGRDPVRTGTLRYPLPELDPGPHSLRLRVWDTSGNMAERTIDFNVARLIAPRMIDLSVDASPAVDHVTFSVRHDRPGAEMALTIAVYDMAGCMVWTSVTSGRADMVATTSVRWNLVTMQGHRAPQGVYIYRATITSAEGVSASASRKFAVGAP